MSVKQTEEQKIIAKRIEYGKKQIQDTILRLTEREPEALTDSEKSWLKSRRSYLNTDQREKFKDIIAEVKQKGKNGK